MAQVIQGIQGIQGVSASGRPLDSSAPPDVDPRRFGASISHASGGVVWLTLSGDLDLAVRDRLHDIVQTRLVSEGVEALLIDLAAVTFLDCSAVGVLIAGRRRAADIGCGYQVVKAADIVAWMFDLTAVRPLLEFGLAGAGDGDGDGTRAGLPRQRRGGLD